MALGLVGLLAVLALAAAPLVSPVERTGQTGQGRGQPGRAALRGSMTLDEVGRLTGVPAGHVLRELGLSVGLSREEPLGRLARQHGFRVEDVRRIVASYGPGRAAGE